MGDEGEREERTKATRRRRISLMEMREREERTKAARRKEYKSQMDVTGGPTGRYVHP